MTVFGLLRVRNETRWILGCIQRILPVCERVFVFDDGSEDGTPDVCESLGDRVTVIRSPFRDRGEGLDEKRDKEVLLQRVMGCVSDVHLRGNPRSPFWALALDADEWLDPSAHDVIRKTLPDTPHHAFSVPIRFLWDSDLSLIDKPNHRRVRVDGVYRRFADIGRPSLFRLFNAAFRYQATPWGGNFHCSSIPQELLHAAAHIPIQAPCFHTGYNDKADRIRKWEFYNRVDPNNSVEDCYRHVCQGDVSHIPPDMRLKHAGPMAFEMM